VKDALRRALESRSEECCTCTLLRACVRRGIVEPVGVRCGCWVAPGVFFEEGNEPPLGPGGTALPIGSAREIF